MALPIFGSCLRATAEDSDGGDRDDVPPRTPRANDARSVRGSERISNSEHSGVEGPSTPGAQPANTAGGSFPTSTARLIWIPAHPPRWPRPSMAVIETMNQTETLYRQQGRTLR